MSASDQFHSSRIVVIGAGAVGAAAAYTLLLRQRAAEIVLIDANTQRAYGEALDMQHGRPFVNESKLWAGTYPDCAGADMVIITAGRAQQSGQTREELLADNASIMESIVHDVDQYLDEQAVCVIATNLVDTLAQVAWHASARPAGRVIGSGTLLDTARLRYLLGQELGVDSRNIHAPVIGEHGDTQVAVWSSANLAGTPVPLSDTRCTEMASAIRRAGYEVLEAKGNTSYAIALALDRICAAVLNDEHGFECVDAA